MAKKTFTGQVVSDKMTKTVVVEIKRLIKHPVYKKIIGRSSRIKADTNGLEVEMGANVKIEQTKPISRDKHFKVIEVLKNSAAKTKSKEASR